MITGASQADAAVLVCSAKEGVQAQTKEHAFLAKVLGINQMIVAVNKMDAVNWDHVKYDETKMALSTLLKNIGYKVENIPFVPISGYQGTNIKNKATTEMPWYSGPTLLECFDKLVAPVKPTDKALRLPIQDVFTITGHGTVPVGRVETGILHLNETVVFMPSGAKGEVKKIEMHHQELQQAIPGDNVGFNVKNVDKKDVKRGEVVWAREQPPKGGERIQGADSGAGAPDGDRQGIHPRLPHPHRADRVHDNRDTREEGPEDGRDHAEEPGLHQVGRRGDRDDQAAQARGG